MTTATVRERTVRWDDPSRVVRDDRGAGRHRIHALAAGVRQGELHMAGDNGARVRRELAAAGVDTAQVGAAAMARLRQGAARGGASFALADVPALRPLPPEPPRESGPRLLGRPVGEVAADSEAAPPAAEAAAGEPPEG